MIVTLPFTGRPPARLGSFVSRGAGSVLTKLSGVAQVTQYPHHRLWETSLEIVTQLDDALRQWSLAIHRLTNQTNRFALTPPEYRGPSTGYAGSGPVVDGAGQFGKSLNVTGLTAGTAILKEGDWFSFNVVSDKGHPNRQLFMLDADAASDGEGKATFVFEIPIRQAPANGAPVEIFKPTALFGFEEPVGGLDKLRPGQRAELVLAGVERVFP